MKHYKKKILVFITAFVMLMSTGAGVFAAEDVSVDGQNTSEPQSNVLDEGTVGDSAGTEEIDNESAIGEGGFGLSAEQTGDGTVSLKWPAEDGEYDIQYFKKGDNDAKIVRGVELSDGAYVVNGLENWTKYVFKIREHSEDDTATFNEVTECTVAPAVGNVETFASFKSVVLEWTPVEGATGYLVQRGSTSSDFEDLQLVSSYIDNSCYIEDDDLCQFTTTSGFEKDRYYDEVTKGYYYRVLAVKFNVAEGDTLTEDAANAKLAEEDCMISNSAAASAKSYCVRTMFYKVYPKMNRKLTSKNVVDGKTKTKVFSKNKPLYCYGYAAGCYYFMDGDYRFRISRINARKQSVYYHKQGTENYSYKEAELFVNRYMQEGGMSNPTQTGYCIWVSFYDQHSYILQYRDGKWQMAQKDVTPTDGSAKAKEWKWSTIDWESSTGKASTPSYTGNQRINSYRAKSLKGIYWWNGYHG